MLRATEKGGWAQVEKLELLVGEWGTSNTPKQGWVGVTQGTLSRLPVTTTEVAIARIPSRAFWGSCGEAVSPCAGELVAAHLAGPEGSALTSTSHPDAPSSGLMKMVQVTAVPRAGSSEESSWSVASVRGPCAGPERGVWGAPEP